MRNSDSPNIVKSAFFMAIGTLASRVLGLVRDLAFAAYFPKIITDAWVVGFRLPNLFRRILGEGSMSSSFIPVFVGLQSDGSPHSEKKSQELVSSVATFLLLVVTVLTGVCIYWMDPIVGFLVSGPGYSSIEGKIELTVVMARIMFPFIALMSFYALFMAILNSFKKFTLAAFAPCLLNIALIIGAISPWGDLNTKAYVQSWAVLVGGLLQMGILIPSIKKYGLLPKLNFNFSSQEMRDVFRGMVPSMLGMSIVPLTGLVSTYYASFLAQGTHSYFYYADRVMELPLSLFAVSLGTALLPTLTQLWSSGHKDKMLELSSYHLKLIFFVSIPSSVGVYFLAQPITQVLFERGQFKSADTEVLAAVLRASAFLVLAASGVRILAPCFYAVKNTWLPALSSLLALCVHVFLAPLFMKEYGIVGLALSSVSAAFANFLMLYLAHLFMIGSLKSRELLASVLKYSVCAAGMAYAISICLPFYNQYGLFLLSRIVLLSAIIALASVVYFMLANLFKIQEAKVVYSLVFQKLKRRLGR
ncbi:MAG: murein biosynthesis integral membrane protein MurJ [Pseudomonadota bacterium]|nr:murein biosynthesis integral membrane protein MurJ [Pseudomonadota bacterium]